MATRPYRPKEKKNGNPIEDILGKAGKLAGDLAGSLLKGEMDQYAAALQGVMGPWFKVFALNAVPKIKNGVAKGISCDCKNIREGMHSHCEQVAALPCQACGRSTCLYHGFITWKGDAVCWHCVADIIQQRSFKTDEPRPGRPPSDQNRQRIENEIELSLQLLGLTRSATAEDISRAFRIFAAQNHPDKVSPDKRAEAEERFKKVSAAYSFLNGIGFGKKAG